MSFNWRTEEDRGWDHEISPPAAIASRRRRWAKLALLLLVLSLAGAVLWRAMQAQAARNREALEQDVRSSHALALRAAQQQDVELLTSLLSGADERWTDAQRSNLEDGLLFSGAAAPFGFEQPAGQSQAAGTITDIVWSPDLLEALLTSRYTQTVLATGESVLLEQTVVYRQGSQRWLLSPPNTEFWGPWQSLSAANVTLMFRERDAQAASQMLPIFESALVALCAALEQRCPDDGSFVVRLERDVATLGRLRDDRLPTFRFGELSLPSPSLVGHGVDERANKALFRGYAVYLMVASSQRLLAFRCCRAAQFMDVLAAATAHDLGYGASPLQLGDYLQIVDSFPTLDDLNQLWLGGPDSPFLEEDRAQVAAFVEFLRHKSGASYAELLLSASDAFGFWNWIQPYVEHGVVAEQTALETSWREFVLAQANAAQVTTAQAAPAQQLQLICEGDSGQRALYGYYPLENRWIYDRALTWRIPALTPMPGDTGVVLFERISGDPARLPGRMLRGHEEIPLPGELAPAYSVQPDPQARFMAMWRISQSGRTVDGVVLLDLESCGHEGPCVQRTLSGLPSWSPDGSQLLVWAPETGRVLLLSRDLTPAASPDNAVMSSHQPFWLDEDTAGLISEDATWIQTIAIESSALAAPENFLSLEPVLATLGRDGEGRSWRFTQAYGLSGAPGDTGRRPAILGAVTLPGSRALHYFLAHIDDGGQIAAIEPLLYVPQSVVTAPDALLSPNGDLLAMHLVPEAILDSRFLLYDLRAGVEVLESRSPYFNVFRAHDWSADGRWLARIGFGYIELATRGAGEQQLTRQFVSSGELQCSSVAWVNR